MTYTNIRDEMAINEETGLPKLPGYYVWVVEPASLFPKTYVKIGIVEDYGFSRQSLSIITPYSTSRASEASLRKTAIKVYNRARRATLKDDARYARERARIESPKGQKRLAKADAREARKRERMAAKLAGVKKFIGAYPPKSLNPEPVKAETSKRGAA